jgi:hypothetical protein
MQRFDCFFPQPLKQRLVVGLPDLRWESSLAQPMRTNATSTVRVKRNAHRNNEAMYGGSYLIPL